MGIAARTLTPGSAEPERPIAAPVRFAAYLQALANEIRKTRSGEKTTLRLLAAGAKLLEAVSYRDLNIDDICADAALGKGTFYIYFKTKDAFLLDLANRFVGFELQTYPAMQPDMPVFEAVRRFVAWYEGSFASNVGVMRCMVQMSEADPAMRALWHRRNADLVDRAMADWHRRFGVEPPDPALTRLATRAVGGILDQSLLERFNVLAGPGVTQDREPEALIELHAVLLFRATTGRNPPREALRHVAALLDWPPPA